MPELNSFGQYRFESELGLGQWTETFHGFDTVRRRPVALKLLRSGLLHSDKAYRDLLAQVQDASELVHPHIAWVWETGQIAGRFFLTERFISARTLTARLGSDGPFPWSEAVRRLEEIAQAIEYAQLHGWHHGRLTPHNILLSPEQGSILSDYGLWNAVLKLHPDAPISLYDAQYLSPDMLQGQPPAPESEIYSFACITQEMLSGRQIFIGTSLEEISAKKAAPIEQPLLPLDIAPIEASELLERALRPGSSEQFESPLAFLHTLAAAIDQGLTDENARQRHQEQLRHWQEQQALTRQQAEEAVRLAALEQARREIHELAHQEAEQIIQLQNGPGIQEIIERPQRSVSSRHKLGDRSNWRRLWPVIILILVLALVLGGYWLSGRRSAGVVVPASSTPTVPLPTATLSTAPPPSLDASVTVLSLPISSPTPTWTPAPSAPATRAPTLTRKPSSTSSPTATSAPILPTSTREQPDDDRNATGM